MAERILIQGGFYKHYKHNPEGPLGNAIYEVLRLTYSHETGKCRVIYRPLYRIQIQGSVNPWLDRPVEEWFEPARVDEKEVERYQHIVSLREVEALEELLLEQYADDIVLLQRNRAMEFFFRKKLHAFHVCSFLFIDRNGRAFSVPRA